MGVQNLRCNGEIDATKTSVRLHFASALSVQFISKQSFGTGVLIPFSIATMGASSSKVRKGISSSEKTEDETEKNLMQGGDTATTAGQEELQETAESNAVALAATTTRCKDWLLERKILVQYDRSNPYALAEFGAKVFPASKEPFGMVLTDIDATGLAAQVCLMENDIIIGINNVVTTLKDVSLLAVIRTLMDVGPNIGLVIKRQVKGAFRKYLIAFHLGSQGGKPIVIDFEVRMLITPVILCTSVAFTTLDYFTYDSSSPCQLILDTKNEDMQIDSQNVTYVPHNSIITLALYSYVDSMGELGEPVAIYADVKETFKRWELFRDVNDDEGDDHLSHSHSDCSTQQMGIFGRTTGPLEVKSFPEFMTQDGVISENDFFFFIFEQANNTFYINTTSNQDGLYLSYEPQNGIDIATLNATPCAFKLQTPDGSCPISFKTLRTQPIAGTSLTLTDGE